MDCKSALSESNGNFDEAIEVLRKRGLKDLSKKADKVSAEGTVGVYIHPGDQVVSLVELNSQTDFVARTEEFKRLAKDIAMHVAAMKPLYLSVEEIPNAVIEKEKEIMVASLEEAQRAKADKILPGKLEKFYQEIVLTKQVFVKDETGKKTIRELVEDFSIKSGEKCQIRRFARFEVGEGIERTVENFAEAVAAAAGV
jgi:elongation factor Ts